MKKKRLDILVSDRGLVESRSLAQRYIMAGKVRVDNQVVYKPAEAFGDDVVIDILKDAKYVSRGGDKLDAAIDQFNLTNLSGLVCADVGASTGGFTDCLLQHGAERVYAIDVGYGQLSMKLRYDSRVIVMERTNAREVQVLPEAIDLVTIDASFISLKNILPGVSRWLNPDSARVIALIKPQFEAGREEAAKGAGVIRDQRVHRQVLTDILQFAQDKGYAIKGLIESPIKGPKGNIEFLVYLETPQTAEIDISELVRKVFLE